MTHTAKLAKALPVEEQYEHVSGRTVAIALSFFPDGGFATVCTETQEGRERDVWSEELFNRDEVTGLSNLVHFRTVLGDAVKQAVAGGTAGVLFIIRIEDTHEFSEFMHQGLNDWMVREIADRLNRFAANEHAVARLSDLEFALMLPDLADMTEDGVAVAAERVLSSLQDRPILVNNSVEIDLEAMIGSSRFPADGSDAAELIHFAKMALSHTLSDSQNRHVPFRSAMREAVERHDNIKVDLRRAIDRGELRTFYQPRIDLRSGHTIGMEALIRWQHPQRGLVPPGLFIPVAERTGLIAPISDWMMRESFRQTKAWKDAGFADLRVSVNLSPRQFQRQSVVAAIISAIDDTGLDPESVEIEITESVLLQDEEVVNETFLWLKSLGITIAVDDFGTGYSSLAYLRRFAIDNVKIDGSFVRELHLKPDDAAIARSIIKLAHSLNMRVVGEGVEQAEHLMFLVEEGCDEGQGYFFGRPMPAEAFTRFLQGGPQPVG